MYKYHPSIILFNNKVDNQVDNALSDIVKEIKGKKRKEIKLILRI